MHKQSFLNIIAKYRNFSPQLGSISRTPTLWKLPTLVHGHKSATMLRGQRLMVGPHLILTTLAMPTAKAEMTQFGLLRQKRN